MDTTLNNALPIQEHIYTRTVCNHGLFRCDSSFKKCQTNLDSN